MIKSVLIVQAIADVCYLHEALFWLAIGRFPLAWASQYDDDGRNNDEWVDGISPAYDVDLVTKDECAFAGLPINPAWEAALERYYYTPSHELEIWIENASDQKRKDQFRIMLDECAAYEKKLAEWEAAFKSHLDLHSARLYVALREGKLLATGKQIPKKLSARLVKDERSRQRYKNMTSREQIIARETRRDASYGNPDWSARKREEVPKEFWSSKNINWEGSYVEGEKESFGLIFVETEKLFDVFPVPETAASKQVSQIGGAFVFQHDDETGSESPTPRLGRPALKWEEFNIEVAMRVRDGLPRKQEAFILDMQAWCKFKWGLNVARSTILPKIKPYYDAWKSSQKNAP